MEELPYPTLKFLIYDTFTHIETKIQDNEIFFKNENFHSEHDCTQEPLPNFINSTVIFICSLMEELPSQTSNILINIIYKHIETKIWTSLK